MYTLLYMSMAIGTMLAGATIIGSLLLIFGSIDYTLKLIKR